LNKNQPRKPKKPKKRQKPFMPPVNDQQPKGERTSRAKRLGLVLILLVTSPGQKMPKKQGSAYKKSPCLGWKNRIEKPLDV